MKILVLQLKRIGDLILTTAALSALRTHFPEARITLCVADGCAGLLGAIPFIDESMLLRHGEANAALWGRIALERFDVCLDFTGNDRSAFFALLSKARRRIAFASVRKSTFRRLLYTEFVESDVREMHTVDRQLDLLQPLGIQERGSQVALHLPKSATEDAACLLNEAGVDGPYAVVHPGTARPEKYWLPERWAAVIDHCQEVLNLPCILTGTLAEPERIHLESIRGALRTPCRMLAGRGGLLTLAALIARARILLSMDSAPVHLGAAFGTPQVALFGATNPFHWRPRHPRAAILMAGQTEPLREFRPRFIQRPLSDLSTESVIAAISSLF